MSGISPKRIVLYRFDRQPSEGFVTAPRFDIADGLEVMSLDGNLQVLAYSTVKAMCFVSETGPPNLFAEHTVFERRPKVPGLWTRFALRDGDFLEGILPHNLAEWPEAGFLATPPRAGSLRQRVFVPRLALLGTELRGIIGKAPGMRASQKLASVVGSNDDQLSMF